MATEESEVAVGRLACPSDSVSFSVVYPGRLSRRNGVQRAIGVLMTWVVQAGLGYVIAAFSGGLPVWGLPAIIGVPIAAGVIGLPLVLAARIRAKGPSRFLAEEGPALERYSRWAIAAAAYALFLTDVPPRESIGGPLRIEIRRGGDPGWLSAAVKPLLLLPHILLLSLFALAFMVIVPVCAVSAIAFQRYPRPFFGYTVGYLRWIARALAYWLSLTDRYPPFSFGEGA